MSEQEGDYGLVMPFVVCQSQGGTLDDHAFVIGYELGNLDAELKALAAMGNDEVRPLPIARYIHTEGAPQADLIAMHHGYVLRLDRWADDDSWSLATFALDSEDGPR